MNAAVENALSEAAKYGKIISGVARAAREAEREKYLPLLQAIFLAYDRSANDPNAKLPSCLMAAIVSARAAVGPIRTASGRQEDPRWLHELRQGARDIPNGQ